MAVLGIATTSLPRLRDRVARGLKRARSKGRPILIAHTFVADPATDPTAVVWASRRGNEPWFVLEQPDRDRTALATLGCVRAVEASGPGRFSDAASEWRRLAREAVTDSIDGPRGSGLVAVGGFAFAPDGGSSPAWDGYAPASLHVPEVALARRGDDVRVTLAADVAPDDDADEICARLEQRLASLANRPLPLLDPDPAGRFVVRSTLPPEHYEQAVGGAVKRIRDGEFDKIVLAREVEVHAPAPHDVGAVLGVLREAFPTCNVFAVGRGDATFLAASPELLVRRDGERASSLALAGSTRRSADPAVDDHLGEQLLRSDKDRIEHEIVRRRIERALKPHSVWVTSAPDPVVVSMANIQHLATPIRAQLTRPVPAVELAGLLSPTPAVGGEPHEVAVPLIPAIEGMDRGWYAGPVGWTDANEDGEFCVALRCALVRGRIAHCYAGVGVVADSDPASELAETEIKLAALLPVLAG